MTVIVGVVTPEAALIGDTVLNAGLVAAERFDPFVRSPFERHEVMGAIADE